jgi:hypothetical protein
MQKEERMLIQKLLAEIDRSIPFQKEDDDDEKEEFTINAKRMMVMVEEALQNMLTQFCNAYILNTVSGFQQDDGTYQLMKFRYDQLKSIGDASCFGDMDVALRVFVKHEALKITGFLLGKLIEGDGNDSAK